MGDTHIDLVCKVFIINICMFKFIASGIKFNWKFDDIIAQMGEDRYYGDNIPTDMHDNMNSAYFQTFYSKVSTSTNFGTYFPAQAEDVLNQIAALQKSVRQQVDAGDLEATELVQLFLDRELLIKDVLFLRIDAAQGSSPHIDRRRKKALNIGFQNSNMCTTYFRPGTDFDNFFDDYSKLTAFTMNDGDAYLLDVGQAHAVKSLVPEAQGIHRYVISHCLKYD